MTRQHWIAAAGLTTVLFVAPAFTQSTSQTSREHEHSTPAQKPAMMGQDHQRMMADMKAADDRLQQLVTRMNAATGDQKVNVMADLLTQLVTDQTNMHHHMMEMHDQMMSQMPHK